MHGEESMSRKSMALVVGENIARRRRSLGLTQEQLAERLNIGQDALSRMEKGVISPKTARLRDFAESLQCRPSDLFRETEPGADELAAILAELISPLPAHARQAIVRIVRESAALADSDMER
jgi:transcriptional regulator with XRE-family HTH domain